jgi:hypothetical protein
VPPLERDFPQLERVFPKLVRVFPPLERVFPPLDVVCCTVPLLIESHAFTVPEPPRRWHGA